MTVSRRNDPPLRETYTGADKTKKDLNLVFTALRTLKLSDFSIPMAL